VVNNKTSIKSSLLFAHDKEAATRAKAIETLNLLSSISHGRSKLTVHGRAKIFSILVDATKCLETKEHALKTLMNLVCRETAFVVCKHRKLLPMLISMALSTTDRKCALIAAQTIKCFGHAHSSTRPHPLRFA
jgi:hypothetical protein